MKRQILKIGFGILTPIASNNFVDGILETIDENVLQTRFIVYRAAHKRLDPKLLEILDEYYLQPRLIINHSVLKRGAP